MNIVILMGNIGSDPVLRFTNSGTAKLMISVATSSRYKANDGEWKERTEWHKVIVWGKRAESLGKILVKGDRISVEGSMRYGSYEKDGIKRYTADVNARDIQIISNRGGGSRSESSDRQYSQAKPYDTTPKPNARTAEYTAANDGDDDDIPF